MSSPPAIRTQRLIGDGATAALLTPNGEIDWWCTPTYDSPPVLWSLLDPNGARARWRGTRVVLVDSEPAGPSTVTLLRIGRNVVECRDALLRRPGLGSALLRLVRLVSGDASATIDHELGLGGFDGPRAIFDHGLAKLADGCWRVSGGEEVCEHGPIDVRRLTIMRDVWSAVLVSPDPAEVLEIERLAASVERIDSLAKNDNARLLLPHHHGERSRHAIAVLRACADADTGAVVASPTTSVPDAPGADRQFDYRYSWLRDSSLAVAVAAELGAGGLGEAYLGFLERLGPDGILSSPMTTARGDEVPDEREVDGVVGRDGARPVRVGNAAKEQLQYDAIGTVLDGVLVHAQTGGRVDRSLWTIVSSLADRVCAPPDRPSSGIWELRDPRWLVSAEVGRWIALDRAIRIAAWYRPWWMASNRWRTWRHARDEAKQRVCDAVRDDGLLPQSYGSDRADASALLAVILGLFDPDDPRSGQIVDRTIEALQTGPFLYRYEPGSDDGFEGVEGAFVPASWWAVSALAVLGRVDQAEEKADQICGALPGLIAEEIDPETGESRGNVPLVWSHMEAARALYLLEVATIRKRYGAAGYGMWRASRYARLWWRRRRPGSVSPTRTAGTRRAAA